MVLLRCFLLRWLTFQLGLLTVTLTVLLFLDYFLSSDASICFTMAFSPLGNSDHAVVSVFIDFLSNSKWDTPLHQMAYDHSYADWDGLWDHLRDFCGRIFLNSVLLLLLVNSVSVGTDVYIPPHEYQMKPHSSPWFSAACAAAIVHRNHFFCLYLQNKSSESKVKFRQASNRFKRFL